MNVFGRGNTWKALVALFVVIVVGAIVQAAYINVFNSTVHTVSGADETQEAYLKFSDRDDSTSTWVKRDFDLNGKTVDLLAQTVDGTFYNNSDDIVESWSMRVNIQHDCFINNAWCGIVEIHQFVASGEEAVQTLDLRNYDIDEVKLAHLFDGDLLIPLQKGDYLLYFPSEKDGEMPLEPHTELTMGTIFYYLDDLDLSSYQLNYNYHRDFTHGIGFIALLALAVLWVFLLVGMLVADASYKRALKESELRNSGLTCMSSLYSVISFINLDNDELVPVYSEENTRTKLPKGAGARKALQDLFMRDTEDAYRDTVLEFVDISTVSQRLERGSISCEYVSKAHGWSQARFFAVEREDGQPLKQVLFTIQDINEEKRQLDRAEKRATNAEFGNRVRDAFFVGLSSIMSSPTHAILDLDEKILHESGDETVLAHARQIMSRGRILAHLVDTAVDTSRAAAGEIELTHEEYSFKALSADVREVAQVMMEGKDLAFETNISSSFPDRLVGDAHRIEGALISLLEYATHKTTSGTVKLSVFGKQVETSTHLLFSVHATGYGMPEDEMENLTTLIKGLQEGDEHGVLGEVRELEMAAIQLAILGSQLQAINVPGEECELYFEIEQDVAGPSPQEGGSDLEE